MKDSMKLREEDLAVLDEIVHDKDARATDRIQAIKIRESIIAESNAAEGKTYLTEADILNRIRADIARKGETDEQDD